MMLYRCVHVDALYNSAMHFMGVRTRDTEGAIPQQSLKLGMKPTTVTTVHTAPSVLQCVRSTITEPHPSFGADPQNQMGSYMYVVDYMYAYIYIYVMM